MSSSNSSDQAPLISTEKLGCENSTTVNQYFLCIVLKYQELKQALKTLAQEESINLETSYLILQNTKQIGSKYELQFVSKDSTQPITIETNADIFYLFKETFNAALDKARPITANGESTKSSLPSLKMDSLDVIDAAS
jgi:hypothetical protein